MLQFEVQSERNYLYQELVAQKVGDPRLLLPNAHDELTNQEVLQKIGFLNRICLYFTDKMLQGNLASHHLLIRDIKSDGQFQT